MSDIRIRPAVQGDLAAIFAIYNHEVRTGVSTFATAEVSPEEARRWLEEHTSSERRPALVADLGPHRVAGWASLSAWSGRCGYARAAEVSVYIDPAHQRRGLGDALLAALIEAGRAAGLGVLLARIESSQTPSLRLHEKHGFEPIGTMHRVGEKFGRILDVDILELHLDR